MPLKSQTPWRRALTVSDVGDAPMTLELAKKFLSVFHSDKDAVILELIREAYAEVESRTGRQIRTANGTLSLNRFPEKNQPIVLPRPPLVSLTAVKYYDTASTLRTLANCRSQLDAFPGLVFAPAGEEWPDTQEDKPNAVEVSFVCGGYEPEVLRAAVRCLLDLAYNDMEATKADQVRSRVDSLLHGLTVRDPRLYGIST